MKIYTQHSVRRSATIASDVLWNGGPTTCEFKDTIEAFINLP
jgi:hypothetical protein